MTMESVRQLVAQIIERHGGDARQAADEMGVSPGTLSRWQSGIARPRSQLERRLRTLAAEPHDLITLIAPRDQQQRQIQLEESIATTLNALREEFHRSASVSTRQEVLDLVASLVFAHVVSIDNGGNGIGPHLTTGPTDAVAALNSFLMETFATHLQRTWRKSFSPLKSTDENFCRALFQIFSQNASAFRELHNAGRDDLINEVFSRFMSTSFVDEKEMGQYLTPPEIVRFMVKLGFASIREGQEKGSNFNESFGFLLDPSCGVGSFLAEAIRYLHEKLRADLSNPRANDLITRFVAERVVGIDKSERMTRLAAINLSLFGADARKLYTANALARSGSDSQITKALEGQVRLILTNPPFGATFSGSEIVQFAIAKDKRKADSEVLFLERYVDWLAPSGVVVSVVPDSVLVNKAAFSELRALLRKKCRLIAVISLPAVTFAAAGTSAKTSILVMRKCEDREPQQLPTYFAEARDVGFDVITRSGQRRRVRTARNDLTSILSEYLGERDLRLGRRRLLPAYADRWDAPFHIGLPEEIAGALQRGSSFVRVSEVARLVDERVDPRRSSKGEFEYIEIADIDIRTGLIGHKRLSKDETPSRARKQVRTGDVLVSTVRPERGSIGMVPASLDGAVCSTGFAVLRCFAIEPLVLVWLLKTNFVRHQFLLNNIGIAYPAISETTCLSLVLPSTNSELASLARAATKFRDSQVQFETARHELLLLTNKLDSAATIESSGL